MKFITRCTQCGDQNQLGDDEMAVCVGGSSNIVLDSNIITHDSNTPTTYREGIYFTYSQNCSFRNNLIRDAEFGFHGCTDLELRNNTLMSEIEEFTLLRFYEAINVELTQNVFLGSEHWGIGITSISNLIIYNNTFDVGVRGLSLYNVQYTLISYNSFYNSSGYAIWIDADSSYTTVYHNNFFYNNLDGASQCFSEDTESIWYNIVISEGNYWSNLGLNSTYEIDGSAGSVDLYPLSNPIIL